MPTSSASSRQKANNSNKRTGNWQPSPAQAKTSSFLKRSSRELPLGAKQAKYTKHQSSSSSSLYSQKSLGPMSHQPAGYRRQDTFQVNQAKTHGQAHFCASPSGPEVDQDSNNNLKSSINNNNNEPASRQTLSLSGQSVLLTVAGSNQHLSSLSPSVNNMAPNKAVSQLTISGAANKSTFLVNNSHFPTNKASNSQMSLQQPGTTNSSTAQLHSLSMMHNASGSCQQQSGLSIQRSVSLKHIKSLIILLMAVDLLITVFVHQFSTQDQLNLWLFVSFKMRFSLLNLILSAIWFAVLIGAILFEVYFVLLISCLVDVASFVLLLVFSIVHFSRRIDYNSVQLTSLLALLFSIVVLHVYLVVLAGLTVYLTLAVKRRQKASSRR